MSKTLFNDNWSFMYQSVQGCDKVFPSETVNLPHDAVISMERDAKAGDTSKGFFPNVSLCYSKKFFVDQAEEGKCLCLQFDGVYKNCAVYVNDNYAGGCSNGYERFFVELNPHQIRYGAENEISVEVKTGNDSRWYTGAGIYRNVYLIAAERIHFAHSGFRIETKEINNGIAALEYTAKVESQEFMPETAEITVEILDENNGIISADKKELFVAGNENCRLTGRIYVKKPKLWDTEHPYLYTCKATLAAKGRVMDEVSFKTGIRVISLDPVNGFCLNGNPVKLYGGCVHHDNGIIGSAAFRAAEDRKIRIMKEAGYNAVRFSHNPMSEELMDACDKYGMLVMDEFSDIWNRPKSPDDFSREFTGEWERAVLSMVDKAYNHPCVVMYSIGNEISEVGTASGKLTGRMLANRFRSLDGTRYITAGVNGMVTMKPAPRVNDPTKEDIQEINAMMTAMMEQMGAIQCMEEVADKTREISEMLDIVGYNYAEDKAVLDAENFPNRICVGSETFPKAIAKNWGLVAKYPNIIGDFSWTAWDYLGEAGIGKNSQKGDWSAGIYEGFPYKLANCGDIDIAGNRRPQSFYREIVIGKRRDPYIAVVNPAYYGEKTEVTPWSWSDSVSSWTWRNYEGQKIRVEVYGIGDEVELTLNGKILECKEVPHESSPGTLAYCTVFETVYRPGVLGARLYKGGETVGEHILVTAGNKMQIELVDQNGTGIKEESEKALLFYEVRLTDENGILLTDCDRKVKVAVDGDAVLQGFGSASPVSTDGFADGEFTTYYGKAALALRPTGKGRVHIVLQADGCEQKELSCTVS